VESNACALFVFLSVDLDYRLRPIIISLRLTKQGISRVIARLAVSQTYLLEYNQTRNRINRI